MKNIHVDTFESGERLDTFLAKKTSIARSQIQKFIDNGFVLVNNRLISRSYRVKADDTISLSIPEVNNEGLSPEVIPLDILYKDDSLVVINKPAPMVVYPAAGHAKGTLMNAIAYHCKQLATVGGPLRPGVVHRLDKETSGIMVIALDDKAYYSLAEQFNKRTIKRMYLVLIFGNLIKNEGEIILKIGRSDTDRKKMSTRTRRGKEAITRWKVIERFGIATLINVKLGTGRTHQIRVHFASIGHPVLGDKTYGRKTEVFVKTRKKIVFPRQMLHAQTLGFIHPLTGEYLEFSSPLPGDMTQKIEELKRLAHFNQ